MARDTLLERSVNERVSQTVVTSVSLAVERAAEEFAREALADPTVRRTLHELVRRRSEAILDRLLRDGNGHKRRKSGVKKKRIGRA